MDRIHAVKPLPLMNDIGVVGAEHSKQSVVLAAPCRDYPGLLFLGGAESIDDRSDHGQHLLHSHALPSAFLAARASGIAPKRAGQFRSHEIPRSREATSNHERFTIASSAAQGGELGLNSRELSFESGLSRQSTRHNHPLWCRIGHDLCEEIRLVGEHEVEQKNTARHRASIKQLLDGLDLVAGPRCDVLRGVEWMLLPQVSDNTLRNICPLPGGHLS